MKSYSSARPSTPMVSKRIRLDQARIDKGSALGHGNLSTGIRAALDAVTQDHVVGPPAYPEPTAYSQWQDTNVPKSFWRRGGMFGQKLTFRASVSVTEEQYRVAEGIGGSFACGAVLAINYAHLRCRRKITKRDALK